MASKYRSLVVAAAMLGAASGASADPLATSKGAGYKACISAGGKPWEPGQPVIGTPRKTAAGVDARLSSNYKDVQRTLNGQVVTTTLLCANTPQKVQQISDQKRRALNGSGVLGNKPIRTKEVKEYIPTQPTPGGR